MTQTGFKKRGKMPVSMAPALSSLLIGGEKVAVFSSHVLPHSCRISNSLVPIRSAICKQMRESPLSVSRDFKSGK